MNKKNKTPHLSLKLQSRKLFNVHSTESFNLSKLKRPVSQPTFQYFFKSYFEMAFGKSVTCPTRATVCPAIVLISALYT